MSHASQSRLGQSLMRSGLLKPEQWQLLLARQKDNPDEPLPTLLALSGVLNEVDLVEHLKRECKLPVLDPSARVIAPELLALVPAAFALRHHVIPVDLAGNTLSVAMADPTDLAVLSELKFVCRYDVRPLLAADSALRAVLTRAYGASAPTQAPTKAPQPSDLSLDATVEDAPVIRLVHAILAEAVQQGASDVHIEPAADALRVRYRCDGLLQLALRPPQQLKNAIASRIKILGDLNIAERRLPQDGRLRLSLGSTRGANDIDIRISVLPTVHGEKLVLRILDTRRVALDLGSVGLSSEQLATVRAVLQRPHGLVLVTGPTGSGKTTSLYAAIAELNRESRNVVTAEDPVELDMPGVNQVQINEAIGLSFATALRAFLRQDPDVIMVGEIRDGETASIAVKAAMTGHLVLSTLHTNDCAASITRLVHMGVEPYLVAASVSLVIAQRLVRRICTGCHSAGCAACQGTGYRGRLALYELCPVDDEVRRLIQQGAPESELRAAARRAGMPSLRECGLQRVRDGATSWEEVAQATI